METPAWQIRLIERHRLVDDLVGEAYYRGGEQGSEHFLLEVVAGLLVRFHPNRVSVTPAEVSSTVAFHWVAEIWRRCLDFGRSEAEGRVVAKMVLLKLLDSALNSVDVDLRREEFENPELVFRAFPAMDVAF